MDFRELIVNKNLKVTPQRLLILQKIYESGHTSIEDLFSCLKVVFPAISLATIYRNVNNMIAKSIIAELKIPNRKNMFELKKQPHSHMICKQCNRVNDIFIPMDSFCQEIDTLDGFSIEEASTMLVGICSQCRDQK